MSIWLMPMSSTKSTTKFGLAAAVAAAAVAVESNARREGGLTISALRISGLPRRAAREGEEVAQSGPSVSNQSEIAMSLCGSFRAVRRSLFVGSLYRSMCL
jgi:hypothetical protein